MYNFNLVPKDLPKVNTQYRKIQTKLPVPESLEIINKSRKYEPISMNSQPPMIWDKAIDYQIHDPYGNIWIDMTSSIFINNTGHGNPHIVNAINNIITKPLLSAYDYTTEIRAKLAKKLIQMTKSEGMEKVFFLSTGSEAIECAIKLAYKYGTKQNHDKIIIISCSESFHGKTLGSQMLIGKGIYNNQKMIQLPFPTNPFIQMEDQDNEDYGRDLFNNDILNLQKKGIDLDNICAFIFNPYIGWSAAFYPKGYIKTMREFADNINALIISDDIQAGFFRTGKLFGYQHYGIKPDILCCGKAISGSLPLSAVLTSAEIMDLDAGLSSTHSGSPVCCAAAYANLLTLENRPFEKEIAVKEKLIKDRLDKWLQDYPDIVKSWHGKGMVFGIFIVKPWTNELDIDFVDEIVEKCWHRGVLLIRTGAGTIKLGMPLTIPNDALLEGLDVIEEVLKDGY